MTTMTPQEHKKLADECEAKATAWHEVERWANKQRRDMEALGNLHYQAYLDGLCPPRRT